MKSCSDKCSTSTIILRVVAIVLVLLVVFAGSYIVAKQILNRSHSRRPWNSLNMENLKQFSQLRVDSKNRWKGTSVEVTVTGAMNSDQEKVIEDTKKVLLARAKALGYEDAFVKDGTVPGSMELMMPEKENLEYAWYPGDLLQKRGCLECMETYQLSEVFPLLMVARAEIARLNNGDSCSALLPVDRKMDDRGRGAVIGYAKVRDTMDVMKCFNEPTVKVLLPENLSLKWGGKKMDKSGLLELYAVKDGAGALVMDGSLIKNAELNKDAFGVSVYIDMNDQGAKEWAIMTKKNIGRCIAMVLDNRVYSAPRVNAEIAGGHAQISGDFTTEEAAKLSILLKSGSLPAPVKFGMHSVTTSKTVTTIRVN